MNTPRKISDFLPSTCQTLLKLLEICLSSDKKNLLSFFCSYLYVQLWHVGYFLVIIAKPTCLSFSISERAPTGSNSSFRSSFRTCFVYK